MTTSQEPINNLKTKPYIKISALKKQYFRIWWIDFLTNRFFKSFYTRKFITEKELKYFSDNFKKKTNLGKLYLLTKI